LESFDADTDSPLRRKIELPETSIVQEKLFCHRRRRPKPASTILPEVGKVAFISEN
jgi:hypothetical protein